MTDADTVREGLLYLKRVQGRPFKKTDDALAALDRLVAERDAAYSYIESQDWHTEWYAPLKAERDRLRELLGRIREWDHLDGAADGPYWKCQIDAALGGHQ